MPKVLRIINRLNLGGPTYNAAYLSKYLAPEFETLLVAGMKDDTEESSEFIVEQMGLKPLYIPEMKREINLIDDRKAYQRIVKIIKDFKPDIVHTHAAKAGTVGRLAAIHQKVPVILHTFHGHVFHSYFSPLKTKLFLEIEKYLARKSSVIISISESQKNELVNNYKLCNKEKIAVIPLGFDLDRFYEHREENRNTFRKTFQLHYDEIAIGIVGRIVPVKNHRLFLSAFKKIISATTAKTKALIIGDGENRIQAEDFCKELGLIYCNAENINQNAKVIFTSWIKNIEWAIAGLDIVALTSLNEGTPVSLIEAQAGAKPIVTTNVGGIEDTVLSGKSALLSSSGNVEEFSSNLKLLIDDSELRNDFGLAGEKFVKERFSYQRLVSDTRKLYHQLLV